MYITGMRAVSDFNTQVNAVVESLENGTSTPDGITNELVVIAALYRVVGQMLKDLNVITKLHNADNNEINRG